MQITPLMIWWYARIGTEPTAPKGGPEDCFIDILMQDKLQIAIIHRLFVYAFLGDKCVLFKWIFTNRTRSVLWGNVASIYLKQKGEKSC